MVDIKNIKKTESQTFQPHKEMNKNHENAKRYHLRTFFGVLSVNFTYSVPKNSI